MATAFAAGPSGITADLEPDERRLLLALVEDLAGLLKPRAADDPLGLGLLRDVTISADPILARLLPDAYGDDEAASDEFRRLTEHGLRTHKSQALMAMATDLRESPGSVTLDAERAHAWLSGLNDLRLALGTRMGLGLDMPDMPEPSAAVAVLYDWLTWVQDGLIVAIGNAADTLAP